MTLRITGGCRHSPSRRVMASLCKIPLVLAAAYTTGVALTAPVPPPDKRELKNDISTREKVFRPLVRVVTTALKVSEWSKL